jgi:hypothetical protein
MRVSLSFAAEPSSCNRVLALPFQPFIAYVSATGIGLNKGSSRFSPFWKIGSIENRPLKIRNLGMEAVFEGACKSS